MSTSLPHDDDTAWAAEREQLRNVVAKQALYDNMVRYCRGIDRRELDLMKSTFWPESTEDQGMFIGSSHDFCELMCSSQGAPAFRTGHYVSNMVIDLDLDGDRAKRETAFTFVKITTDGTPTDVLHGRYRDLCERRDSEWKVLARTCIWDAALQLPPQADFTALFGIPSSSNFGGVFPEDPSYVADWQSADPQP